MLPDHIKHVTTRSSSNHEEGGDAIIVKYRDKGAHFQTDTLSWKAFIVLHLVVHMENDRNKIK